MKPVRNLLTKSKNMLFPEPFVFILIILSLLGITAAAITLVILLIRDIRTKNLW